MQYLRDLLEKCVHDMASPHAARVIERLRSTNSETFLTAEYEVLLYAFFRSRGWLVRPNEPLRGGDTDLLVDNGSHRFFMEIATLFPSGQEGQRLALSERVIAQLDVPLHN